MRASALFLFHDAAWSMITSVDLEDSGNLLRTYLLKKSARTLRNIQVSKSGIFWIWYYSFWCWAIMFLLADSVSSRRYACGLNKLSSFLVSYLTVFILCFSVSFCSPALPLHVMPSDSVSSRAQQEEPLRRQLTCLGGSARGTYLGHIKLFT